MIDPRYIETVRLLLDVLPDVFEQPKFALKGGTAINLFVEDMPRLSVDIDVVYTDHLSSRQKALEEIAMSLSAVQSKLEPRVSESNSQAAGGKRANFSPAGKEPWSKWK